MRESPWVAVLSTEYRSNIIRPPPLDPWDDRAIIAVSGGVDSTTCAELTRKAIGDNLVCVFIDTDFMRRREPEAVK